MDKNRQKGADQELKGTMNEVVGKVTDDDSQELKGKVQKNVGKIQREFGEARDDERNQTRH